MDNNTTMALYSKEYDANNSIFSTDALQQRIKELENTSAIEVESTTIEPVIWIDTEKFNAEILWNEIRNAKIRRDRETEEAIYLRTKQYVERNPLLDTKYDNKL
jgi:hypothetical protein